MTVPLVDNAALNAPREFALNISTPSAGHVLGSVRTTRVSISDDEISDFSPFAGNYAGNLDSAPYTHSAAGFLKVTLSRTGRFTASIRHGGKTTTLTGRLNPSGGAEIPYKPTSPTALKLLLDRTDADHLTATILEASAPVTTGSADRSIFSKQSALPSSWPLQHPAALPAPGPR